MISYIYLFIYFQERSSQARIADLEAQLSRATANAVQMKREKDEVDIKNISKVPYSCFHFVSLFSHSLVTLCRAWFGLV